MPNSLRLYGFSENDRKVFSSYLSILSHKMNATWSITNDWPANIVFIDIECDEQEMKINKLRESGQQVVVFGAIDKIRHFERHIQKPLRAADILTALDSIGSYSNEPRPEEKALLSSESYRLMRWPPKSVLAKVQHSSRLCAVMMQRAIDIDSVAKMVGLTPEQVHEFIGVCQQHKCIKIVEDTPQPAPVQSVKNSALFDKIRLKFGVNIKRV